MKIKIFVISILISIFLIVSSVHFNISFNKGTAGPQVQNGRFESIDSKANTVDGTKIKSEFPLTNEDFVIKDKNNYIELRGEYGDLNTKEKITKTVPADENHIYDVYEFENFKLITEPAGDSSSIIEIDLTTPVIQTSRGISVGDTISEVVEKYGNPDDSSIDDSIAPGQYMYQYNSDFLTFFVDKTGIVTLIRFEIV